MGHFDKTNEFHQLSEYIQKIADDYFVARDKIQKRKRIKNSLDYVTRVKKAYEQLDPVDQNFINNEFFYQKYPMWWQDIYSKTTFYRLKRKSMESFKEAFENGC